MEQKTRPLINTCGFAGIRPAMVDLPYPPTEVREENPVYADLLSIDYCGSVSEMSAITQYINNQNRLSCEYCPLAKTLLEIAVAEMMHLQKLGELIWLLGGKVDFTAGYQSGRKMWTPAYLSIPENARQMILDDIESEKDAINQYKVHINRIGDDCVDRMLIRIIRDEEYHIMILRALLDDL